MKNNDILEILCNNITRLRKQAGLTKQQVAQRVGINYSNYCRIENNKVEPRLTTVIFIAEAIGAKWEELLKNCH